MTRSSRLLWAIPTRSVPKRRVNSFRAGGTRSFITRGQAFQPHHSQDRSASDVATPVPNYIYISVSGDFTESCGTCETYQVTTNQENVVDDLFWTRG